VDEAVRGKQILCWHCDNPIRIPPPPLKPASAQPKPGAAPKEVVKPAPAKAPAVARTSPPPIPTPLAVVKESVKPVAPAARTLPGPAPAPAVAPQEAMKRAAPTKAHLDDTTKTDPERPRQQEPPKVKRGLAPVLFGAAGLGCLAIAGVVVAVGVVAVILLNRHSEPPATSTAQQAAATKNETPDVKPKDKVEIKDPAPKPKESGTHGSGLLSNEVLTKVQNATAYFRVWMADGSGAEGSGFLAIDKGLILTNAHVVGMLRPDQPLPRKIEVTLNSGEPVSRTFQGSLLAVDRDADLALVRIPNDKLPPLLEVKPSAALQLTQPVYVFGFPYGEKLGKNVPVSPTSVSSLRRTPAGELSHVQVNGGMHPGNSGGPVVNSDGDVVGISVSVIKGTQINFAVPGESVHNFINGRVSNVGMGHSFKDAGATKVRFNVEVLDPLQKVRKLSLVYWVGNSNPRDAATAPSPQLPGDLTRQQIDLHARGGFASTDLMYPVLQPNQSLWVQSKVVNGAGQTYWSPATPFTPYVPLNPEVANLSLKPFWGARTLQISSKNIMHITETGQPEKKFDVNMVTRMVESTLGEKQDKMALLLNYRKYEIGVPTKELSTTAHARIKAAVQNAGKLWALVVVDKYNNIETSQVDLAKVAKDSQADLADMHGQIQDSLEMLSVPLLGRPVQPGEQWKAARPLLVFSGDRGDLAPMIVTYTYQGTEVRNGHKEAVIAIEGVASTNLGSTTHVTGRVTGKAHFDIWAGQIALADVTARVEIDKEGKGKMIAALESKLERSIGEQLLSIRGDLTPQSNKDKDNHYFNLHELDLEQGKKYMVGLESTGTGNALFDVKIMVIDVKNNQGTSMTAVDVGPTSVLEYTPKTTGKHRIMVTTHGVDVTGPYLLVVRRL
jgi:S1-C subfamily serine protease